jgi:hypothetical protein
MEYEIDDDPQGEPEREEAARDGGIVEDHIALKNQSSVKARQYPKSQRENQSLVNKDKSD